LKELVKLLQDEKKLKEAAKNAQKKESSVIEYSIKPDKISRDQRTHWMAKCQA
jgi:hypothetical protein